MDLKVGDRVWYASYLFVGDVWECIVIHVPKDPGYEVELDTVMGLDTIRIIRPRRRLFHNILDARNAAV